MSTFVVLLRGINVGGKNLLPMKEFKIALALAGFEDCKTYIQSGNIVLSSAKNPEKQIAALILNQFGLRSDVLALSSDAFNVSVANNPYKEFEGKTVHFYFCKTAPKPNYSKLDALAQETERYELAGNVLYLLAPNGIGRSKVVAGIEACLGVTATGRNLNTVRKLADMVENT